MPIFLITIWKFIQPFIGKILLGGIALTILTTVYISWSNSIKEKEDLKLQTLQLQTDLKAKEAELVVLKKINDNQYQAIVNLNAQTAKLHSNLQTINKFLESPEAKASDRTSSLILKKTFEQLQNISNPKPKGK